MNQSIASLPKGHQTMLLAHRAMVRNLDRIARSAELAKRTVEVYDHLSRNAADEERELLGRLAPVLGDKVWKGFADHMRKTAPGWTLRFIPARPASVAGPGDKGGAPAPPVARLFRGWLQTNQQAAFGDAI